MREKSVFLTEFLKIKLLNYLFTSEFNENQVVLRQECSLWLVGTMDIGTAQYFTGFELFQCYFSSYLVR